ncbi:sulfatase-like hydrolase/transferase [Rhodopirellula sallentina]|nr:sulfatase-like hydrolase/transferase [Rhodopirellula sallentina]
MYRWNFLPSLTLFVSFSFLTFGGVTAAVGQGSERANPWQASAVVKPNVLLILADDMGYADIGCHGSTQIPTPNIDALAQDGVLCTQAYVSGAVCSPSRAGILTGRYQQRFGWEHNFAFNPHVIPEYKAVPKDERMIPQYLRPAGYATAIIGKWHLGLRDIKWQHPLGRGFDYYFGRYGGHGHFPKAEDRNILRGFDPVTEIEVPYTTDWYTKEAIDFIDRTPADTPWFLYLSHDTPHTPLQAKQDDIARFSHIKDEKRRVYAAMQHCLDENIGRLVKHLKDTDQYDQTLIVFFSDNGGAVTANASLNSPLWGMKGILYEGGIRVPMIFSWPDGLPSGVTYKQPLITLDLLPTLLSAAGIERTRVEHTKRKLDGVNLLPYLRGEFGDRRPHQTMYWRIAQKGAAVRDGDLKLIRTPFKLPMLFDLGSDVSEQSDLASQQPDKVDELMRKLNDWELTLDATPVILESVKWQRDSRKKYEAPYETDQPIRSTVEVSQR